jgi:hypothetical protein
MKDSIAVKLFFMALAAASVAALAWMAWVVFVGH